MLLEVIIRPYRKPRNNDQNARLWHLYRDISEQVEIESRRFSPEVWHEHFKREFIGREEMPDGSLHGKTSTKLNTKQFADFMTQVEAFGEGRGVIFQLDGEQHETDRT